jgi:hypothetical protein
MMNREIEIALADEKITDAAENLGVIALAQFRKEDTNCLHPLSLEGSGDHAGLVIELGGGLLDTPTGCIGNRTTG